MVVLSDVCVVVMGCSLSVSFKLIKPVISFGPKLLREKIKTLKPVLQSEVIWRMCRKE